MFEQVWRYFRYLIVNYNLFSRKLAQMDQFNHKIFDDHTWIEFKAVIWTWIKCM